MLASGSFDRTVCILDARQSTESAVRVSTGDAGATRGEKKSGGGGGVGGEGEEGGECSVFYLCRGRVVDVLWACVAAKVVAFVACVLCSGVLSRVL